MTSPLYVLGYHRVLEEPGADPFGITLRRSTFQGHLDLLSQVGTFIRPGDLAKSDSWTDGRPRFLLTFDDGYRDTYNIVLPILRERQVPAILFLATGYLEKESPFWWEVLARSRQFLEAGPGEQAAMQERWRKMSPAARNQEVHSIIEENRSGAVLTGLTLDWDLVREIQDSKWITLGAHTRYHSSLAALNLLEAAADVEGAVMDLQEQTGHRPELFAWPHGGPDDYNADTAQVILDHHFRYGFTTDWKLPTADFVPSAGTLEAMMIPRLLVREQSPEALLKVLGLDMPADRPDGSAWGRLRSFDPVSRDWGFDRGLPVDRHYIESFLRKYAGDVKGDVCELLNDSYTKRYGGSQVRSSTVLDINADNRDATMIDDLAAPTVLGENRFDCFILTQTLQHIYHCGEALANAWRSLKPGGVILATVPSIIRYHREPEDHWRFTPDSMERMIRERCPGADFTIKVYGNLVAATAFLHGMAVSDLRPVELDEYDGEYPVVIAARIMR